MKIDRYRVENFRCIRDSGEIELDSGLTILIGENESGKTALLEALAWFNEGETFRDVDISTRSAIRPRLETSDLSRDQVDIVTVWVTLTEQDKEILGLRDALGGIDRLKVTKRLDHSYAVFVPTGQRISEALPEEARVKFMTYLGQLLRRLQTVFEGEILRKQPFDRFVFIRSDASSDDRDNLILFPEAAGELWEDLQAGDRVQVSKIAEDPFGRNRRAMTVGRAVDLGTALSRIEKSVLAGQEPPESGIRELESRLGDIPPGHPLEDYINVGTFHELRWLVNPGQGLSTLDPAIVSRMPRFIYPKPASIGDSVAVASLRVRPSDAGDKGLEVFIEEVGLRPELALQAEPAERMKIFDEKSTALSNLVSTHWVRPVSTEFVLFAQDRELGLAVNSQESLDPPSRRSRGFNEYLALLALTLQMQKRKDVVLLLDDPAVHLHPTAQRKLSEFLAGQSFQVVIATHLPFMINPCDSTTSD